MDAASPSCCSRCRIAFSKASLQLTVALVRLQHTSAGVMSIVKGQVGLEMASHFTRLHFPNSNSGASTMSISMSFSPLLAYALTPKVQPAIPPLTCKYGSNVSIQTPSACSTPLHSCAAIFCSSGYILPQYLKVSSSSSCMVGRSYLEDLVVWHVPYVVRVGQ